MTLPERHYDFAGMLMAQAITDAERESVPVATALHTTALETGRELGEAARERVGPDATQDSLFAATREVLEEHGYEPRTDTGQITLANCPFHALAQDYTELVCGMNLDLLRGLIEGLGSTDLEARLEPAPGRCCVVLGRAEVAGQH